MSLRFVLGRAGSGKSTFCLNEIRKELRSNPQGFPLILLVPEQSTHQMEMSLANTPDLGGIMRAQVLSFRRLGWKVLAETGGGQRVLVGELGKRMILRKILLQHRFDLRAFARSVNKPGMADRVVKAIGEFKTYRIQPNDLKKINKLDKRLEEKIADLALLYEEFETLLGQRLRDPDDELNILAEKINGASSLRKASFWIDGFKGFTPQELHVLKQILPVAQTVTVTLPFEPELIKEREPSEFFALGQELFTESWQTYQQLQRLALDAGTEILQLVLLSEIWRFKYPSLSYIEKYYFAYPTLPWEKGNFDSNETVLPETLDVHAALAAPSEDEIYQRSLAGSQQVDMHSNHEPRTTNHDFGVHLCSAVNPRAEVEGVARELRRLAREHGYRWREMAILTRDLSLYHDLIEQVFTDFEVPFFLDAKRSIMHHPLIELLQSALEVVISDWAYEPLFRCLKTDFFPLTRESIDRLENYCLAYGIRGWDWRTSQDWAEHPSINAARSKVREVLLPLVQTLAPGEETVNIAVKNVTAALYELLERMEVPKQLERWAIEARQKGELAEARVQEQIWAAIVSVLDEIVAGLSDEYLSLEDYAAVLASGMESLRLGLIPPGLDQVLVGGLDRSRNPEVRVLFLVGASEGILPARPGNDGLFDEVDREKLLEAGLALAPKGKYQIYEEQFFIYTALTRASEELFVSYPLTDEEGKEIGISPVVMKLKNLLPDVKESFWGKQDDDWQLISHPKPILEAYARQVSVRRQEKDLSSLWYAVEQWLSQDSGTQAQVKLIQSGITAKNHEPKIPRSIARRLYGPRLLTSVSRLEQFAACPFAHFAAYGLKLRERSLFELSSPDMGQFFHALLREFAETVISQGLNWGAMTTEQSWALLDQLTEGLAPQISNKILLSSARYRYITNKLKRTVHRAVRVLAEHARRGVFVPIQLEVRFGPGEELPGLNIALPEGGSMVLRGQIDRVDGVVLNGQVYLRVLDYKSRPLSLSLESIYYGIDLQLLTYLDVALQGAEILISHLPGKDTGVMGEIAAAQEEGAFPVSPAGFLYFPVIDPQLVEKTPLSDEELEYRRLKAVKISGYLLAKPDVLEAMDKALAAGQSDLLGLKKTKEGSLRRGSKVLTEEQFSLLRSYLHGLLRETGEKIQNGEISLSPYRRGKDTGCQYCSYKPVCHFDLYLPENQYRPLPALQSQEIWEKLKNNAEQHSEKGIPEDSFWLESAGPTLGEQGKVKEEEEEKHE